MSYIYTRKRYNKNHKKSLIKKNILKVYLTTLAIAVILVGFTAFLILNKKAKTDVVINSDKFYTGVYIEDVDLSNKTMAEAENLITQAVKQRLTSIKITLKYKDKVWNYTHDLLNSSYNVKNQLRKAYSIGRIGTYSERLAEINKLKNEPYKGKVEIDFFVDVIKPQLYKIKQEVDYAPKNATVIFDPSKTGKNMFSYTDEGYGGSLNVDKLYNQIVNEFEKNTNNVVIDIKLENVTPEVKRADIEKNYVLVSSFSTPLSTEASKKDRTFNVHKSTNAFNGYVLYAGDVLSYNRTVGDVTAENGFKEAPVITPDKTFENEIGGGICQSSTTLFNAALMADLEIVMRSNHSIPSSYVNTGRDAMVSFPYSDLKIKNNRKTPVFFASDTGNGYTKILVYGEALADGVTIELDSKVIEQTAAPKPTLAVDTENKYKLAKGKTHEYSKSRSRIVAECYKIYKKNGVEIKRVVAAKSIYPEVVGVTYISPLSTLPPGMTSAPTSTPSQD